MEQNTGYTLTCIPLHLCLFFLYSVSGGGLCLYTLSLSCFLFYSYSPLFLSLCSLSLYSLDSHRWTHSLLYLKYRSLSTGFLLATTLPLTTFSLLSWGWEVPSTRYLFSLLACISGRRLYCISAFRLYRLSPASPAPLEPATGGLLLLCLWKICTYTNALFSLYGTLYSIGSGSVFSGGG